MWGHNHIHLVKRGPPRTLCSEELPEPFPSAFLRLGTGESLWLPLVPLALLGESWLQACASRRGLFWAGLAGFWEDEDEDDAGVGGSISFFEGSEGLGVLEETAHNTKLRQNMNHVSHRLVKKTTRLLTKG